MRYYRGQMSIRAEYAGTPSRTPAPKTRPDVTEVQMTRYSSQVALDERYLSPNTGSRFAHTPLREGDPRRIGRYRLTARLGAGGMGVVYLGVAEDGRLVAVKVMRPELADNPE